MKKTTQLRAIVTGPELDFLMEAHNGLSAKIVENTGFKGIWASSLTISASMGVRDNNEASWTQILEVLDFMNDAIDIPILLDGDTGYGDFNNVRRLVKKLEQRDISGVCIEDKLFPKRNSLLKNQKQSLADVDEFCGKIKAAKDTQRDDDFVVVARVEALIAGLDVEAALERAYAYREAGADAILIHSKQPDFNEIEQFLKAWDNCHPVVLVPTAYYTTPTDLFRSFNVNTVIWANHSLRAATSSMEDILGRIYREQSILDVEDKIAGVGHIFELQNSRELAIAEKKYMPTGKRDTNTVILAASQGELGVLTDNIPKAMLKVDGKPIIQHQTEAFRRQGTDETIVVCGFEKDKINLDNIIKIENSQYLESGEAYSLFCAKKYLNKETIISFGDIIFKRHMLVDLLNAPADVTIVVDAHSESESRTAYWVRTDVLYAQSFFARSITMVEISTELPIQDRSGEFVGLWKVSKNGARQLADLMARLSETEDLPKMTVADLLRELAKTTSIAVQFVSGSWLDINTIVDLQKASGFTC